MPKKRNYMIYPKNTYWFNIKEGDTVITRDKDTYTFNGFSFENEYVFIPKEWYNSNLTHSKGSQLDIMYVESKEQDILFKVKRPWHIELLRNIYALIEEIQFRLEK